MFRNWEAFEAFEREWIASEPPDLMRNLRMVDAMYEYARKLGKLPGDDPLEGIEKDIYLASVLRRVRSTP